MIPEEQVKAAQKAFPNKTVTSVIKHDNVSSESLTKAKAKDLALGIGKQVGGCLFTR